MDFNNNPVIDQIFKHRSVRIFDKEFEIPREHIEIIIKAGQQASTSCSGQMYTVLEIPKENRETISPLCGDQQFVRDASFFCVICVDLYRLHRLVELVGGENPTWPLAGLEIGIYDAGLLGQNMVLAAQSLGYDICFCGSCADQPNKMIEELNLPEFVIPLTGLAIGKGLEDPPTRPRIQSSLIHHIGKYREYSEEELQVAIEHMSLKLNEEGYYQKYTNREDYSWTEHLQNKFGGQWLNLVEKRRVVALKNQKFLS
ncbi:MAG: nitroreductase family protein [Candidatus Kariarchaeaceae archaeon]|jgi:nitroreductase